MLKAEEQLRELNKQMMAEETQHRTVTCSKEKLASSNNDRLLEDQVTSQTREESDRTLRIRQTLPNR